MPEGTERTPPQIVRTEHIPSECPRQDLKEPDTVHVQAKDHCRECRNSERAYDQSRDRTPITLAQKKKEKNRGKYFEPGGRCQQRPSGETMASEDSEESKAN